MTRRGGYGFTLIELVVALGIFAVLSVMAYGGLNSVLDSRRAIERSMEETAAMQKAYLRLRNDLQLVVARPSLNGFGKSDPPLLTTADGRLEFTRNGWGNSLLQARSTLERVSYRLDEKKGLLRESWRVLDRAQDSVPVELPLLDDADELRWRFLDAGQQWQTQWPVPTTTQNAPSLPRAVEITLHSKHWGELRFLFQITSNVVP